MNWKKMKVFEKFKQFKQFSMLKVFNKNLGSSQRYTAFTLAEVLITLGIIGIVAALTIPALIQSYQNSQYKTAYKKVFSQISQAFYAARNDYSFTRVDGDLGEALANNKALLAEYKNMFKVVRDCTPPVNVTNCWDYSGEHDVWGGPYTSESNSSYWSQGLVDISGFAIVINHEAIFLDINNFKGPNQWGKDRFEVIPYPHTYYLLENSTKLTPLPDNTGRLCGGTNKCATTKDYFGTTWLYK